MREFVRPVAVAASIACFAALMAIVSTGDALAQAKEAPAQAAPPPQDMALKQIALTEKQIEGVLAAAKDMDAITAKLPENAKPDPKITAQLEDIAKKNELADLNEALKSPAPPIENKGNIDLVAKYYDKLAAALGDDEQ